MPAERCASSSAAWRTEAADALPDEVRELVEGYNRDDCASTRALRDWLEALRPADTPRPVAKPDEPRQELKELDARIERLQAQLLEGFDPTSADEAVELRRLLAYLLDFHRREDKAQWWEYYRLLGMPADELLDEGDAIAGLCRIGPVGADKRSVIVRFSYPPQEMDLSVATT